MMQRDSLLLGGCTCGKRYRDFSSIEDACEKITSTEYSLLPDDKAVREYERFYANYCLLGEKLEQDRSWGRKLTS